MDDTAASYSSWPTSIQTEIVIAPQFAPHASKKTRQPARFQENPLFKKWIEWKKTMKRVLIVLIRRCQA